MSTLTLDNTLGSQLQALEDHLEAEIGAVEEIEIGAVEEIEIGAVEEIEIGAVEPQKTELSSEIVELLEKGLSAIKVSRLTFHKVLVKAIGMDFKTLKSSDEVGTFEQTKLVLDYLASLEETKSMLPKITNWLTVQCGLRVNKVTSGSATDVTYLVKKLTVSQKETIGLRVKYTYDRDQFDTRVKPEETAYYKLKKLPGGDVTLPQDSQKVMGKIVKILAKTVAEDTSLHGLSLEDISGLVKAALQTQLKSEVLKQKTHVQALYASKEGNENKETLTEEKTMTILQNLSDSL